MAPVEWFQNIICENYPESFKSTQIRPHHRQLKVILLPSDSNIARGENQVSRPLLSTEESKK